MGPSILAIGRTMLPVGMVSCYMRMEMFTKGIGRMIKPMVMESTLRKMVSSTKDNGRMISSMAKELRCGEKMPIMKGTFNLERRLELEN
jgi:hypothetical protein